MGSIESRILRHQTHIEWHLPALPTGFRFVFFPLSIASRIENTWASWATWATLPIFTLMVIDSTLLQKTCRQELQGCRFCAVV